MVGRFVVLGRFRFWVLHWVLGVRGGAFFCLRKVVGVVIRIIIV